MLIINEEILIKYSKKHANAKKGIQAWIQITQEVTWKQPLDVLNDFPTAKLIPSNRARFCITGGNFRLIVEIDYEFEVVDIRFIGTHTEYDNINAKTI